MVPNERSEGGPHGLAAPLAPAIGVEGEVEAELLRVIQSLGGWLTFQTHDIRHEWLAPDCAGGLTPAELRILWTAHLTPADHLPTNLREARKAHARDRANAHTRAAREAARATTNAHATRAAAADAHAAPICAAIRAWWKTLTPTTQLEHLNPLPHTTRSNLKIYLGGTATTHRVLHHLRTLPAIAERWPA